MAAPAPRSRRPRLLGLETEYAVRFTTEGKHPGNDRIFRHIMKAVRRRVEMRPGASAPGREQLFAENGGAFYYEFLPHCHSGGLVEGATPECRGPLQALLYQRAQERLLREAVPEAQSTLRTAGWSGELGLLKNCRDAEDHIYGAQESYEVPVARGLGLVLYRLGLAALLPLLAVQVALTYAILCLSVGLIFLQILGLLLVSLAVPPWLRWLGWLFSDDNHAFEDGFGRFHVSLIYILTWPVTAPFAALLHALAFREIRRSGSAFLVSRSLMVGSGSVTGDGKFRLAEKAPAVRRLMRWSIRPGDRPVFDTGNLMKMLCAPLNFQLAPVGRLFRRSQRLQLGIGDSNRAQVAEYLKVGSTALVLDMIEDGFLRKAPRPRRPVEALHAIAEDPTLRCRVEMSDGSEKTGLELQRFYLAAAEDYLRSSRTSSLEARRTVELWRRTLDDLENRRAEALLGRLDWVTKRYLLDHCPPPEGRPLAEAGSPSEDGENDAGRQAFWKTLDLRYHELGSGYYDRFENAGLAEKLVDEREVARAVWEPPEGSPAFFRGRLIREQSGSAVPVRISWDSAALGNRFRAKVIPFRGRQEKEER